MKKCIVPILLAALPLLLLPRSAAASSVRSFAQANFSNFVLTGATVLGGVETTVALPNVASSGGLDLNPGTDPDTTRAFLGTAADPGENNFAGPIDDDSASYGWGDSLRSGASLFGGGGSLDLIAEASSTGVNQGSSGSAGYSVVVPLSSATGNISVDFDKSLIVDSINTGLGLGFATGQVSFSAALSAVSAGPTPNPFESSVTGIVEDPAALTDNAHVTLNANVGAGGSATFILNVNVQANANGGVTPEPGAAILAAVGGIGLICVGSRRNRRRRN